MRSNPMIPVRGAASFRAAAALFVALFAVACSSSNGPEDEVTRDLIENASDWESLGITDYTFTFTRTCFCPVELFRPAEVVVRNNAIESVTYVDDGQPVDPAILPSFQTIDELFEMIADAIEQDAVMVDVTYDPDLHYPTDGYIDISEQIADEEQGFTATELVPNPAARQQ